MYGRKSLLENDKMSTENLKQSILFYRVVDNEADFFVMTDSARK